MLSMLKVAASSTDACYCVACGSKQLTAASGQPCETCSRGQVFSAAQLLTMFMEEPAIPRRAATKSEECPF